jgi:hypothetical protein
VSDVTSPGEPRERISTLDDPDIKEQITHAIHDALCGCTMKYRDKHTMAPNYTAAADAALSVLRAALPELSAALKGETP